MFTQQEGITRHHSGGTKSRSNNLICDLQYLDSFPGDGVRVHSKVFTRRGPGEPGPAVVPRQFSSIESLSPVCQSKYTLLRFDYTSNILCDVSVSEFDWPRYITDTLNRWELFLFRCILCVVDVFIVLFSALKRLPIPSYDLTML